MPDSTSGAHPASSSGSASPPTSGVGTVPGTNTNRSPRGGAAENRNPAFFCPASVPENDDGRCHNYRVKDGSGGHLPTCRLHGSSTPGSKAVIARGTIAEIAAKQGIVLPEVKAKDFVKVAEEMISWHVSQFASLSTELEALRLLHSAVEHAREYGDLFAQLSDWNKSITGLMKAAAALPTPPADPLEVPPSERLAELLAGVASRLTPAGAHCQTCTCGEQKDGTAEAPLEGRVVDPSQGPQTPAPVPGPWPGSAAPGGVGPEGGGLL